MNKSCENCLVFNRNSSGLDYCGAYTCERHAEDNCYGLDLKHWKPDYETLKNDHNLLLEFCQGIYNTYDCVMTYEDYCDGTEPQLRQADAREWAENILGRLTIKEKKK